MTSPPTSALQGLSDVDGSMKAAAAAVPPSVVMLLVQPESGPHAPTGAHGARALAVFTAVARTLQSSPMVFVRSAAPEVLGRFPTTRSAVFKLELNEEPIAFGGETLVLEDLLAWVRLSRFPIFPEISAANFRDMSALNGGRLLAVAVLDPSSKATEGLKSTLRLLARPASTPLSAQAHARFVFSWIDGIQWADFVKTYNIQAEQLPRWLVLDMPNSTFWEDASVGLADLDAWLGSVASGNAEPQRTGALALPTRFLWRLRPYSPYGELALALLALSLLGLCWRCCCRPGNKPAADGGDDDAVDGGEETSAGTGKAASAGGGKAKHD